MTSYPPTLNEVIDQAIQITQGQGIAQVVGQSYDVRRLSASTNVSISSNAPIISAFPTSIRRYTTKVALENATFDLLSFVAVCDNRALQLGDEFTETGYKAMESGVYVLAQMRPLQETIWMRTESNIAITRMLPSAGQESQQPASGWVAQAPGTIGAVDKRSEQVLTLKNGTYAFTTTPGATPAGVVCGLQPLNRIRDTSKGTVAGKWPTALYREHFLAYMPLIPGEEIVELDRLNFPNSDRYEVMVKYTSEQTGISGYILIVEKLGT